MGGGSRAAGGGKRAARVAGIVRRDRPPAAVVIERGALLGGVAVGGGVGDREGRSAPVSAGAFEFVVECGPLGEIDASAAGDDLVGHHGSGPGGCGAAGVAADHAEEDFVAVGEACGEADGGGPAVGVGGAGDAEAAWVVEGVGDAGGRGGDDEVGFGVGGEGAEPEFDAVVGPAAGLWGGGGPLVGGGVGVGVGGGVGVGVGCGEELSRSSGFDEEFPLAVVSPGELGGGPPGPGREDVAFAEP